MHRAVDFLGAPSKVITPRNSQLTLTLTDGQAVDNGHLTD